MQLFKYIKSFEDIKNMFEEHNFKVTFPCPDEYGQKMGYDFQVRGKFSGHKLIYITCSISNDFTMYGDNGHDYSSPLTSWLRSYMTKKYGKDYLDDLKAHLIDESTRTADGFKKYLPQDEAE